MIHNNSSLKQIDPDLIPGINLSDGGKIPVIGLGTFGSDSVDPETVAATIRKAIFAGYSHIDCAAVYGNEADIGHTLNELLKSGSITSENLQHTRFHSMLHRLQTMPDCTSSVMAKTKPDLSHYRILQVIKNGEF